jgi:NADPH:quinone reductase-like Zn-dependent oxidoreductase
MAKYHGASKVFATGRNKEVLEAMKAHGADEIILINEADDMVIANVQKAYADAPIDIVVDYLWGHPTELILTALSRTKLTKHLRYVTVGQMAGGTITLPSQVLRSKDIELIGSGIGSFDHSVVSTYMREELPKVFEYAAKGNLFVNSKVHDLSQVADVWSSGQSIIKIQ